jgi:hypothetical protein
LEYDNSGVCSRLNVYSHLTKADSKKAEMCCTRPNWPDGIPGTNLTLDCTVYEGLQSCGPFASYGGDLSLCCAGGKSLLICDSSGITLISQSCPAGYSCVQNYGYGNKRFGGAGTYAECKKIDL